MIYVILIVNHVPVANYKNPFMSNFDKFKKNIKIIKEVCHTKYFEIMGGEPLLNKDIMKYVDYASEIYKNTDTKVVLLYKWSCSI